MGGSVSARSFSPCSAMPTRRPLFIRNFSASFPYDSLVFDTQKFGIATFKGCKVTIHKSAFVPRTDGVCPMYRWHLSVERSAPFSRQIVSFVGSCRTYSAPFEGTSFTQRDALADILRSLLLAPLIRFAQRTLFQSLFHISHSKFITSMYAAKQPFYDLSHTSCHYNRVLLCRIIIR